MHIYDMILLHVNGRSNLLEVSVTVHSCFIHDGGGVHCIIGGGEGGHLASRIN